MFKIIWSPGWAKEVRIEPPDLDVTPDMLSASKEVVYILDRFMSSKRNALSAYDASEGTLYLLFIATILAHAESPPIFALDNVDGTLNPAMVRKLVQHIVAVVRGELGGEENSRTGQRQVFLTSHNPTALDAIDLFESDQRLFVVSRNDKGHTGIRAHPTLIEDDEGTVDRDAAREKSLAALAGRADPEGAGVVGAPGRWRRCGRTYRCRGSGRVPVDLATGTR